MHTTLQRDRVSQFSSLYFFFICSLALLSHAHQTIGQLKPEHVLLSALKVLKEKLVMVETHLSETLVEASFDSAQSAGDEEYQM